jgi:hypothetical protein
MAPLPNGADAAMEAVMTEIEQLEKAFHAPAGVRNLHPCKRKPGAPCHPQAKPLLWLLVLAGAAEHATEPAFRNEQEA